MSKRLCQRARDVHSTVNDVTRRYPHENKKKIKNKKPTRKKNAARIRTLTYLGRLITHRSLSDEVYYIHTQRVNSAQVCTVYLMLLKVKNVIPSRVALS